MLYDVMSYCNNFFVKSKHSGVFKIEGGRITLPFLKDSQIYRIEGSTFNDGVYVYPYDTLQDEEFWGTITACAPPKAFLDLCELIEADVGKEPVATPYVSESWNGWSGTRATNSNGVPLTVIERYAGQLRKWRKIG